MSHTIEIPIEGGYIQDVPTVSARHALRALPKKLVFRSHDGRREDREAAVAQDDSLSGDAGSL